jgi:hypothetical protein
MTKIHAHYAEKVPEGTLSFWTPCILIEETPTTWIIDEWTPFTGTTRRTLAKEQYNLRPLN